MTLLLVTTFLCFALYRNKKIAWPKKLWSIINSLGQNTFSFIFHYFLLRMSHILSVLFLKNVKKSLTHPSEQHDTQETSFKSVCVKQYKFMFKQYKAQSIKACAHIFIVTTKFLSLALNMLLVLVLIVGTHSCSLQDTEVSILILFTSYFVLLCILNYWKTFKLALVNVGIR